MINIADLVALSASIAITRIPMEQDRFFKGKNMADYFSHDYGARNDPKLLGLQMAMGQEGKGIFWDLIEMMYEQEGYLLLSQCDRLAFAMRTDSDKIKRVINEFDLFENDTINFWNESVLRRLKLRNEKSEKARISALSKGLSERSSTGKRTLSERSAIKEIKERKGNKIYSDSFELFWKEYPNKKDKGHASKEFEKQIKKTDPQTIIDGAKRFAVECQGKEPQYIKYAQGWLYGQRWLDQSKPEDVQPKRPVCWGRPD